MLGRSDAGEHEEFGRVEDAGGEDDLFIRVDFDVLMVPPVNDAFRVVLRVKHDLFLKN